jgi:urea transport system ATP-binding protein
MLKMENVNSYYGRSKALQDFSLEVAAETIFAVLGRNGVGKTTLLRTILGLTDLSTGKIVFSGNDISELATHERARSGIAYVPQGRMIIPDFSVKENIVMGSFASDGNGKIPELVPELFPYLMDNLDRAGGLLSGGQQQQLAIARALAAKPKILLMDEPTEGIQPNIVEQIEASILKMNSELKITIILVEQNVQFAKKAAHDFAMIEHGTVVANDKISNLSDELIYKHMAI